MAAWSYCDDRGKFAAYQQHERNRDAHLEDQSWQGPALWPLKYPAICRTKNEINSPATVVTAVGLFRATGHPTESRLVRHASLPCSCYRADNSMRSRYIAGAPSIFRQSAMKVALWRHECELTS
jgi:hypothetical protein